MVARKTADFTQGNLMRHVVVMSFTSSFAIMAIYLVDLLDLVFISMLGHKEMAAAAGIAGTLLYFVSTINVGFSIATGTLVGRALGKGNREEARDLTGSAIVISTAIGIILPATMIPNLPFLLGMLGADGEIADLARSYLLIILPATFVSGISMNLVAGLRAEGAAKYAMYPALGGAAVTLVLDPILIFGLGLGLHGAAAATVVARIVTAGIALYPFYGEIKKTLWPGGSEVIKNAGEIGRFAGLAVFSSVAMPIGQAIIIRYMHKFGAEAVAGVAVIGRLTPVVFSVINALTAAIGPIIAQNFGAGRLERVRGAYIDAIKFLGIYVTLAVTILFLLRDLIADAFGATGLTRDLILLYCSPFAVIAFFNGLIGISNAAYNNLGRPKYSTYLNWAKNTIGLLPFLAVGAHLYGVWGAAFGILASAALFAGLSITVAQNVISNVQEEDLTKEEFAPSQSAQHSLEMTEDALQV